MRDPSSVDAGLVELLLDACVRAGRPAEEAEVRAALAPLDPVEEKTLRRAARATPPARPLGPQAWADIARGTDAQVAAAREVTGYYALAAERDALAAMVRGQRDEPPPPPRRSRPRPEPEPEPAPEPRVAPREKVDKARVNYLLGLFTYHRDAPSVARALNVSLEELNTELDALKIRRKAYRIARGTDADLPVAAPIPGAASSPPVRRRVKQARPPAPPPLAPEEPDLEKLLAEVGARRAVLAHRLGLAEPLLLARVREAGLEREFALRERDLIRALYAKHRGADSRVADDLRLEVPALHALVRERGLLREIEGVRERFRRIARGTKWPTGRIGLLLDRAPYLRELGIYDELLAEARARVGVLWKDLPTRGRTDALARMLRLEPPAAEKLRRLLDLR